MGEIAPTGDAGGAFVQLLGGAPALLVVAHPDDETIGVGGHLGSLPGLTVLHLTSAAPRDPAFARAAGLATPQEYAEARARELDRAMDIAGVDCSRRRSLALPDQEAPEHLAVIARAVRVLIRASAARVVLTHAYEGGHPDHDAAAFAVWAAARSLRPRPVVLEMPYYHRGSDGVVNGAFLPLTASSEHEVTLSAARLARKRAMLACFSSQASALASFDPSVERFRLAPEHDFTRPPHDGAPHYETLGWPMTGARLCERAAEARRALALE